MSDDWGIGAIGVAIGGFITGLWAWLTQRSKGGTDIEVAAIAEWEKLYRALSGRVSALEQQLADVRSAHAQEIEQIMKDHIAAMDALRENHRAEMKKLRTYCEGLERQIAQNSRSTAHLLTDRSERKGGGDGK